ncbi:TetR/AcrR family transcriptional regulator [Deinococcus koreensis]|nr:TetR/AcrR family transcriptional regulator [Deinococcus koreensis]
MPDSNATFPLTHRQRQARATRELIVQAATDLFLEGGYSTTTMDAIAARAGVAVSTVYNAFTNKRGILKAIREGWHQTSGQRDLYRLAGQQADPARRLELAAQATRRQWESGARMMAVYSVAAASDPEAAAELREALAGRRSTVGATIRSWAGDFRMPPERAAALYLALTRAEVYLELVAEQGWTPAEYEAWLASLLKSQFLR